MNCSIDFVFIVRMIPRWYRLGWSDCVYDIFANIECKWMYETIIFLNNSRFVLSVRTSNVKHSLLPMPHFFVSFFFVFRRVQYKHLANRVPYICVCIEILTKEKPNFIPFKPLQFSFSSYLSSWIATTGTLIQIYLAFCLLHCVHLAH